MFNRFLFTASRRIWASGSGALLASALWRNKPEPGTKTVVDAVRDADVFYNQYMIDNAYGLLRKYRKSTDPELLWRLARVICEQGKSCANSEEKLRLFKEALAFAESALTNEEEARGSFGAHKWYAITLNYLSELEGTRAQIKSSLDVKRHLERALEINPMDPTTWMVLGMWHYSFAELGTASRLVATAIYGSPPSSTFQEAQRHFERAETIQPNFCSSNNYYLGLVYEKQNRKADAVDQLTKAFLAPCVSVDDNHYHKLAFDKLKKVGVDANKLYRNK